MSDPGSAPKVGFEWCGCDEFLKEAREIAILTPVTRWGRMPTFEAYGPSIILV